jgi:hypothetical protein
MSCRLNEHVHHHGHGMKIFVTYKKCDSSSWTRLIDSQQKLKVTVWLYHMPASQQHAGSQKK